MKTRVFDTECYPNYWLFMALDVDTGEVSTFEKFNDVVTEGRLSLDGLMVSFNGNHYDVPMILRAPLFNNLQLKKLNDFIILGNKKSWEVDKAYGEINHTINHIDLIEVAPGKASLKVYGGRLGIPQLKDAPFDFNKPIEAWQRQHIRQYCYNDLLITKSLYLELLPVLKLREEMGARYGLDLRSKSDAQIAEAVIRHEMTKITGKKYYAPTEPIAPFFYQPPSFIEFKTPGMQAMLEKIKSAVFTISPAGGVTLPPTLDGLTIALGGNKYTLGIGGLHSNESNVSHKGALVDRDVASYYPSLILNNHIFPPQMGEQFLTVYRGIVEQRLEAKRNGDKKTADMLKIVINGTFGKLNSKYSALFYPKGMIQVTLTGQLSLLMLIESLELGGVPVISANTDGVVYKEVNKCVEAKIISDWESKTGLVTEETRYSALYSNSVNSYIAVKEDGSVKCKGFYASSGTQKNPSFEVCNHAVIDFLTAGVPVWLTVRTCTDIKKFLTIRKVEGGAVWNGELLGTTVRWYKSTEDRGPIQYQKNGNKVPDTDRCAPMMELPASGLLPDDLDYAWYINECDKILKEVGYYENLPNN